MATDLEEVELLLEGPGFMEPIERQGVRWLAQRRHEEGTWHRNKNRQLRILRRSNDLFDFVVRATHTEGPNTWFTKGVVHRPFVEDACREFHRMGLIAHEPCPMEARAVFERVVAQAQAEVIG